MNNDELSKQIFIRALRTKLVVFAIEIIAVIAFVAHCTIENM
jgi:hypothetical protein